MMKRFSKKQQLPLQSRTITLGEINTEEVNDIIRLIYDINDEDTGKQKVEPIRLIINSFGGDVYSGLGLIDVMNCSTTPIYTICHGSAMSMGFQIFIMGHHRIASKNATFMYHESSYPVEGKVQHHINELHEVKRIEKILDDYTLEKTLIPAKKLKQIKSTHTDWYITAQEALEYGVVDKVI